SKLVNRGVHGAAEVVCSMVYQGPSKGCNSCRKRRKKASRKYLAFTYVPNSCLNETMADWPVLLIVRRNSAGMLLDHLQLLLMCAWDRRISLGNLLDDVGHMWRLG